MSAVHQVVWMDITSLKSVTKTVVIQVQLQSTSNPEIQFHSVGVLKSSSAIGLLIPTISPN